MTLRDKLEKAKEIARSTRNMSLNVLAGGLACVTLFGMCGGGPILYFHLGSKEYFEEQNRERSVHSGTDGTSLVFKDLNGDGIVEKKLCRPGKPTIVYEGYNAGGPLFYDLKFRNPRIVSEEK